MSVPFEAICLETTEQTRRKQEAKKQVRLTKDGNEDPAKNLEACRRGLRGGVEYLI